MRQLHLNAAFCFQNLFDCILHSFLLIFLKLAKLHVSHCGVMLITCRSDIFLSKF